jgi:hypothetical protein
VTPSALTENLYPDPDDRRAATADYRAEHGLSRSAMRLERLPLSAMREIEVRACVIKLMRIYARRWRVFNPEGPRPRPPSRQPKPAPKERLRKRARATVKAFRDTSEDTRLQHP